MNKNEYKAIENKPFRKGKRNTYTMALANGAKAERELLKSKSGVKIDELIDFLLFVYINERKTAAAAKKNGR